MTAGLIGGIGFADAQNNVSPYDPNYIYSTDWFLNLEATVGIVMLLDKASRQAISMDAGYNFDQ
jgi:hypothetical protein